LSAVNPAWTTLLGYEERDLLGLSFTDLTHPDDMTETLEVFRSVFGTPLVVPYEFRLRHKDGSYRATAWTASFNNGAVYATGRDVTEQHRQAAALTATETALRQSQKLETIGQLTGGVAHDFNNLLMAIRSSLDLLERRLPQGDERLAGLVRNAVKATERGASLTQRMLAFARKQELDSRPVDVAQLLRGMRDLIEKSIGPQIAVTLEASCESNAMADPNQLELAVLNLAINARDAMDGAGELVIGLDCVIEEEASDLTPGEYVRIRIQDNGAGMDAQTLAQAAEPFFTTKGIGKGTGLGLSMVHGLASQSGGTFRLSSTVGVGTTAAIYLPVAADAHGSGTQAKRTATPAARSEALRILAVDDDALVLFGSVALLEDLGHHVLEAGSGAEALNILNEEPDIDLVMTDQAMPNMTGVDLARAIHELRPELPVILASGYAEIPEGAGNHIAARLEKPFTEDLLRAALQKALDCTREPAE
ncbi:MAG TPA: ATP-binding protein, partial [Lautropia sp.]|nr:ATP-binding protein [Lautropia sp.]